MPHQQWEQHGNGIQEQSDSGQITGKPVNVFISQKSGKYNNGSSPLTHLVTDYTGVEPGRPRSSSIPFPGERHGRLYDACNVEVLRHQDVYYKTRQPGFGRNTKPDQLMPGSTSSQYDIRSDRSQFSLFPTASAGTISDADPW